jgi:hypothetical protein
MPGGFDDAQYETVMQTPNGPESRSSESAPDSDRRIRSATLLFALVEESSKAGIKRGLLAMAATSSANGRYR